MTECKQSITFVGSGLGLAPYTYMNISDGELETAELSCAVWIQTVRPESETS